MRKSSAIFYAITISFHLEYLHRNTYLSSEWSQLLPNCFKPWLEEILPFSPQVISLTKRGKFHEKGERASEGQVLTKIFDHRLGTSVSGIHD